MVSFLGLMDTIKLKPKLNQVVNKDLVMTQYMLKMLTILTNILVTNLIAINSDSSVVGAFIDQVVVCLTQSACPKIRARLNELDSVIPKAKA